MDDINKVTVTCGDWDIRNQIEIKKEQSRNVKEVITDPFYHVKKTYGQEVHDVALLIMDSDFELDEHIGTICLPDVEPNYQEKDCKVMGWGRNKPTEPDQDVKQEKMKQISMDIVTDCQEKLIQNSELILSNFKLDKSLTCASASSGNIGEDSCKGDGGGSLVCKSNDDENRYLIFRFFEVHLNEKFNRNAKIRLNKIRSK